MLLSWWQMDNTVCEVCTFVEVVEWKGEGKKEMKEESTQHDKPLDWSRAKVLSNFVNLITTY